MLSRCCPESRHPSVGKRRPAAFFFRLILTSTPARRTLSRALRGESLTTYSFYPQVNYLGYYDQNGLGLANSHLITLWDNSSQTIIASATVPAGTAAPLAIAGCSSARR